MRKLSQPRGKVAADHLTGPLDLIAVFLYDHLPIRLIHPQLGSRPIVPVLHRRSKSIRKPLGQRDLVRQQSPDVVHPGVFRDLGPIILAREIHDVRGLDAKKRKDVLRAGSARYSSYR